MHAEGESLKSYKVAANPHDADDQHDQHEKSNTCA